MYSKIKIFEMFDVQKSTWDVFLQNYKNQATVFHTQEWMKTLHEAYKYEGKYLVAMNVDDSFVAVIPFMIDKRYGIENYLSMPYDTYGGVIGDLNAHLNLSRNFMKLPGIGVRYFIDYSWLVQDGDIVVTQLKDISSNIESIWNNLHKDNRTAIKSARKHNVIIRDIIEYVDIFDNVSKILLDSIIKNMIPSGLCKIYVAEIDNEIVAASIFFIYNDMIMYWTNTTTKVGRKTNANYLLLWEAIQYAKECKCKIFNFGASPPDADSLVKFKKSWGTISYQYIKCQKVPLPLYPLFKLRQVFQG